MVRDVRVHRTDHAKIVRTGAQVRKDFTDLQAALPMLIEPKGGFHQTPSLPLGLEIGSGRSLAIVLGKGRFGVERIDLRGATVHEQVDDPFGSRWKHRLLRSQRILRRTDQRWVLSQEPLLSKDTG
jgi:hypothetical protein